jgi:arylsulfatase A-like enzyme
MVVENDPSDNTTTKRYTEHAVSFIEQNKDTPFFLYLAPNMAHVPLGATQPFQGTSPRGLYGDVIAELDWSVGQVVATLQRLGLEGSTLVVITSDNGPWLAQGKNAGSAGPLREGKHTTFEGGMRTPMIVRWPGIVPAGGVSDEPVSEIDLLPTIAGLAGAALPTAWTIDGKDILSLMRGEPGAKSPHDALFFYNQKALEAVRSGKWKLHFPHAYQHVETGDGGNAVVSTRQIGLSLFDLDTDIGEQNDVAGAHPDVVQKLTGFANLIRADIGDSLTGQTGQNVRPAGIGQTGDF